MKQAGKSQGEIAQAVGFSQGTISRELSRNHGERGYPTFDGNGNVSEYLDGAGAKRAHYEYDAFGNLIASAKTGDKADDFAHRFSTKPLDFETGLYDYGFRHYDPLTGRWPSRDPIGEEGGINLYGFVGNDGVNGIDLFGLDRLGVEIFSEALVRVKHIATSIIGGSFANVFGSQPSRRPGMTHPEP